ncbi:hypothetical protein FHG87_002775 [Trinorchestia longiramus]|nr:hypothetical protein FHG87_002775 [Trinorchestia longiramus]
MSSPAVMSGRVLVRKLISVLWTVVSLVKRCFCCVRRRRDSSDHGLPIMINTTDNYAFSTTQDGSWGDWDGGPSSVVCDGGRNTRPMSMVEQHIQQYRQQKQQQLTQAADVPQEQPNLLESLAPKIVRKPQVVIYARPDDDDQGSAARTSLSCSDALMQVSVLPSCVCVALMQAGGPLGDWDEEGGEGQWGVEDEAVAPEEVEQVLQQQRQHQRQLREARKQHKLQLERENRTKIATKIS